MSQRSVACVRCGAAMVPDGRFCSQCGADNPVPSAEPGSGTPRLIDGRYEILERLGEGGFGPTYLVQDVKLGTRAVLKLRRHADPEFARRLASEVVAFSSIHHPNIASITGSGVTGDGTPYLVM